MNAWKLNGVAGHCFKQTIYKNLNIPPGSIYKVVKSIDRSGVITTADGREFTMKLIEIKKTKK